MAFECDTLDNNEIVASIKFTVYTTSGKYLAVFWFAFISNLLSGNAWWTYENTDFCQLHSRASDWVDLYGAGTWIIRQSCSFKTQFWALAALPDVLSTISYTLFWCADIHPSKVLIDIMKWIFKQKELTLKTKQTNKKHQTFNLKYIGAFISIVNVKIDKWILMHDCRKNIIKTCEIRASEHFSLEVIYLCVCVCVEIGFL